MKKVLVIHYSQTGQLTDILRQLAKPLIENDGVEVYFESLKPTTEFPFPWPFLQFFNTFPETVHGDAPPNQPLEFENKGYEDVDLIILGYTVWFLSPSLPTTAFLQSREAKAVLNGKPVVTVVGCRNMWLMSQEKVKALLSGIGARLVDNVVLIDAASTALSFVSTPLWMLTGKKQFFSSLPPAGIDKQDIKEASRFGEAIVNRLMRSDAPISAPMLEGLKAVQVNDRLIASEKVAQRSFFLWGKLLRFLGTPNGKVRQAVIYAYVLFLLTLIVTVVPISAVIKRLLSPLTKSRIEKQKAYYSAPSGDGTHNLENVSKHEKDREFNTRAVNIDKVKKHSEKALNP